MGRITIYPSKELREKINKEGEVQGRSMNNLILRILNLFFKHRDRSQPKTESCPKQLDDMKGGQK